MQGMGQGRQAVSRYFGTGKGAQLAGRALKPMASVPFWSSVIRSRAGSGDQKDKKYF